MAINMSFEEILIATDASRGENSRSVEGLVVAVLAEDFPLTLDEIAALIEMRFKHSLDLPKVKSAVEKLKSMGIVVANKNTYKMSHTWIRKMKDSFDELYNNMFPE